MFILVPIPVYNEITEQQEDETIALVPLDPQSIKSLRECKETGNLIIDYKMSNSLVTLMPFIKMVKFLSNTGSISFLGSEACQKISLSYKQAIEEEKANRDGRNII